MLLCIKNKSFPQAMSMRKTEIFETDGKRQDERETCFPKMIKTEQRRGQVRDDR